MSTLPYVGVGPTADLDLSDNAYLLSLQAANLAQDAVTTLITNGLNVYATRAYVDAQDALNATKAYIDGKYADGSTIPNTDLVNYNPNGGDASRILKARIDTDGGPVGLDAIGKLNRAILTIPDAQKWPSAGSSPSSYNASPVTTGGVASVESTVYSYTVPDPGYPYNLLVFGQVDVSTSVDDNYPIVNVRADTPTGTLVGTGTGVAENYGIAPAYDATGVGYNGASVASFTYNHTGTAGAYLIVDIVNWGDNYYYPAGDVSAVTYNGSPMTLISTIGLANAPGAGRLMRYGMANIPGGTRAVSVTFPSATLRVTSGSVSYTNVASVGTTYQAYGSSGSIAHNVVCGPAQRIVQAFGSRQGQTALSVSGGTNRGVGANFTTPWYYAQLSISDATATTNFTASATSTDNWASLATVLNSTNYPNHSTAVIEPYFANTPPNPPTFDASGSGYLPHYGGAKGEVAQTGFGFVQTAAANSYVIIDVVAPGVGIASVYYDGVLLTPLAATYLNNTAAIGSYNRYGVVNTTAGTKTIAIYLTGYGAVSACSVSYTGVKQVGTTTTMYASGTSLLSQHVDCWPHGGQTIVQGFAADQVTPEWALSGGTPRYGVNWSAGGETLYGIVEISDSGSSTTFEAAATISNASGIATVLTGVLGTPAQSSRTGPTNLYMRLNSSATGAVTATTTNPSLTAIPIPAT